MDLRQKMDRFYLDSVSYTHLDVYKRQEWPFVPLWTEGFFISPAPWKASHFPILIKR